MKPYDPRNLGRPQIRVPGDDDEGPNPYDSRTPFQTPAWLSKPSYWVGLFFAALGLYLTRLWFGG